MTDHESGRFHGTWRTFEPIHIDGPTSPHPPRCELVVGVDAHPEIHPALLYAIAFAGQLAAGLRIVHTIDPADYPIEPDSPYYEQEFADTLESECTRTRAALATFTGSWSYDLTGGDPAHLLTTIANACDAMMIVIGTPHRGLTSIFERFSRNSVATHLMHHTHRPLLMVPDAARFSIRPDIPVTPPAPMT